MKHNKRTCPKRSGTSNEKAGSRYYDKQWERFNISMEKNPDMTEAVVQPEPEPEPEEETMHTRRREAQRVARARLGIFR